VSVTLAECHNVLLQSTASIPLCVQMARPVLPGKMRSEESEGPLERLTPGFCRHLGKVALLNKAVHCDEAGLGINPD
jgi:hypothetical protein